MEVGCVVILTGYWSTRSFPFIWSITNNFQNPWARCSCPAWDRRVRRWSTISPSPPPFWQDVKEQLGSLCREGVLQTIFLPR